VPLSNYALDKFVSQQLSELGTCTLADLDSEFPDHANWIDTFVKQKAFTNHIPDEHIPLAFAQIRRADAALDSWAAARASLAAPAIKKVPSQYFYALRHLETVIACVEQAYNFGRKSLGDVKMFTNKDGSAYERLNSIYNLSRHAPLGKLPPGHLHPVWVVTNGIRTAESMLSYEELQEQVREVARVARALSLGTRSGS
jgi:ATP-dependent exoDNAse (exonuclease V) beta subunit